MKRGSYFFVFLIVFAVEAWIALYVHDDFIRPYVGDILVVFVVYFFIRIIFPKGIKFLWLYVTLFAVAVEISQYFNLVKLLGLEKYSLAHIILGSVFDWKDILCYVAGGLLLRGGLALKKYTGSKRA